MKKTSKYLNQRFGNWICTEMGIANVQGKKKKAPGAINHYYIFERITSDLAAEKIIRLNSTEAAKVYRGIMSVEEIMNKRKNRVQKKSNRKISYHFIDSI